MPCLGEATVLDFVVVRVDGLAGVNDFVLDGVLVAGVDVFAAAGALVVCVVTGGAVALPGLVALAAGAIFAGVIFAGAGLG